MKKLTMVTLLISLWAAVAGAQVKVGPPVITSVDEDVWIVGWKPTISKGARLSRVSASHGQVVTDFHAITATSVRMSRVDADRLRLDPSVRYVVPEMKFHITDTTPNDTYFDTQWGLKNTGQADVLYPSYPPFAGISGDDIDAVKAWDVATGDSTLLIGMIDTGIDYNHPDLANNIWTNPGETPGNGIDDDGNGYIDDVHGYAFGSGKEFSTDIDPLDFNGHGTHTAGIVASRGNNGAGTSGVMWKANLVAIKCFDDCGNGSNTGILEGLQYALDNHIKLTSNSYGGMTPFFNGVMDTTIYDDFRDMLSAAADSGMLFVAAAGNDGANIDSVSYYYYSPGGLMNPNILCVAASTRRDARPYYSDYGAARVDVAAPGHQVSSSWASHKGGGYVYLNGTSMATPMAAGTAGLIWSKYPFLSWQQVKTMLMNGVEQSPWTDGTFDFYGDHNGIGSKSRLASGGRINAYNSLLQPKGAKSQSDVMAGCVLTGTSSGIPAFSYGVTVRDSGGALVPNVEVKLVFDGIDSSMRICDNSQYTCSTHSAVTTTDSNGEASFYLTGKLLTSNSGNAELWVDGADWGPIVVSVVDVDNSGGIDGNDFSGFLAYYFDSAYAPKVDYNGNGEKDGDDYSLFYDHYSNEGTGGCTSPDTLCAAAPGPQTAPRSRLEIGDAPKSIPTALIVTNQGGSPQLLFSLSAAGPAKVEVFDVAGRRVATLFDGQANAGVTKLSWSRQVSPGAYFARFTAGRFRQDKKISVVR